MKLVLATAIALLASSGCYTVNADLPGTWRRAEPAEDIVVVGRVDQRATHFFFLFGLAPQPERSVFAGPLVRAVEASGGDGVANVVIDSEFTLTDALIRGVTLGVVAPRSYRVRADIVRIPGAPPPGRQLLKRRRGDEPTMSPVPVSRPPSIEPAAPAPAPAPLDPNAPPALLDPADPGAAP